MVLFSPVVHLELMARLLRVKPAWLRDEVRAGRVPALAAGEQLLFNADAVRAELAKRAAKRGRR